MTCLLLFLQANAGFDFWKFMAGLGLFIFAMSVVERAIRDLSGRSIRVFLQKQANYPFRIIVAALLITALLQSSSLVLMLVLSYCSAGILPVSAALMATLGANIGTTLDTWLIVWLGFEVHLEQVIFPALAISAIVIAAGPSPSKLHATASMLFGLALLLLSMEWLKQSLNSDSLLPPDWLKGSHYLLFIPAGLILTAIIQSSLATAAIALSAIHQGLISFEQAAGLIIGAETGTTLKFLLATAKSSLPKKKVAWGNFYINLITSIIAAALLNPLIWLIKTQAGIHNDLFALAALQTTLNTVSLLLFIPFIGKAEQFLDAQLGSYTPTALKYLQAGKNNSADPLRPAYLETLHLFSHVFHWNRLVLSIEENNRKRTWLSILKPARKDHYYKQLKTIEGEILEYLSRPEISDSDPGLDQRRRMLINSCRYLGRSAKCMKDIQHNVIEFDLNLNEEVTGNLHEIKSYCTTLYTLVETALQETQDLSSVLAHHEHLKSMYEVRNEELVTLLGQRHLGEVETTNLLNFNREVYESNRSLLKAVHELNEFRKV